MKKTARQYAAKALAKLDELAGKEFWEHKQLIMKGERRTCEERLEDEERIEQASLDCLTAVFEEALGEVHPSDDPSVIPESPDPMPPTVREVRSEPPTKSG
jgi:hypothetical protein